jgi:hypothetical protein
LDTKYLRDVKMVDRVEISREAKKDLARIREAAARRVAAAEARRIATEELKRSCIAARKDGVPMTVIAAEAGLSRQGLYDLLDDKARKTAGGK